jgi:hypothetical protein
MADQPPEDCLWMTGRLVLMFAALFGGWGFVCLFSGIYNSNCLQDLARAFITACTGSCIG